MSETIDTTPIIEVRMRRTSSRVIGARSGGKRDVFLGAVSSAQLGVGIVGMVVARKRRHAYDLPLLHGRPENVPRDSIVLGTALSAPVAMLAVQGAATAQLLRKQTDSAALVVGLLGTVMIAGYLGEALVRRRLHLAHFDRLETPVVVLGLSLAGAMAALGLTRPRAPKRRGCVPRVVE